MVKEVELAWLAGILDGEGSVFAQMVNKCNNTGGNLSFEIRVEATSAAMIMKIARLYERLDLKFTFEADRWHKRSTKPAYRVVVYRTQSLLRLIKLVRPYLVVKGPEVDLVESWYEKWGDQRGNHDRKASLHDKLVYLNAVRELRKTA